MRSRRFLASPNFLYRPISAAGSRKSLVSFGYTSWEMPIGISFSYHELGPTAAPLDALAGGLLTTTRAVQTQPRALLGRTRVQRGLFLPFASGILETRYAGHSVQGTLPDDHLSTIPRDARTCARPELALTCSPRCSAPGRYRRVVHGAEGLRPNAEFSPAHILPAPSGSGSPRL